MPVSQERDRQSYEESIKSLLSQVGRDDESEAVLVKLNQIIEAATNALQIPSSSKSSDDAFLSFRGLAYFKKYHHRKRRDNAHLESAISDFQSISGPHANASNHVQALLAKSYPLKPRATDAAITILQQALDVARTITNPTVREKSEKQVELNLAECRLRLACNARDLAAIRFQCEKILSYGQQDLILFPLSYAAKVLLSSSQANPNTLELVRRIMNTLDTASQRPNLNNKVIAQLSSHAASLSLALGREFAELTLSQYLRSVTADRGDGFPFKCSIIGRLALDVGKKYSRAGDHLAAIDYFRDAVDWLQQALSLAHEEKNEVFDVIVTHCCLGEAYLRQQSIIGGASLGRRAL